MFLFRPPILAALLLILAGCARHREPIVVAPASAPAVALETASPVSVINRDLSGAARIWHLRVALNVAALACRGDRELQIVADYNALLRARPAELGAAQRALAAEFRARGGDWQDAYDDAMTRLYNFFSQTQARDAFCAAAADVLAEMRTLPASALAAFAGDRLALVDAPFARLATPAAVLAAAAPPIAAPRLRVSVAAIGE